MIREYDPYIQHTYTLSSPISNFGKSPHPWNPIFKDGEVYLHMHFFSMPPTLSRASEQSNWDDIEDAMDNELLLLSKPQSGEGKGNWGDQGCWSLHLLLCPRPLEGHWGACSSSEP